MFDASAAVREREATGIGRGSAEVFDQAMYAANRGDLATKADIAELRMKFARLEAKFDATINKMLWNQVAVAGGLLAAMALLKFF